MDNQPKLKAQAESTFFYDGAAMRTPVADTVAQGELHEDSAYWTGKTAAGAWIDAVPGHAPDATTLARGEQRFGIYCSPCHGPLADGKGMLFQRTQVQSANLMSARFRAMPVGQLFDEVTHGVGLMPAYGPFVTVADRWAILAYMRRLQAQTPVPEEPAVEGAPATPVAGAAAATGNENAGAPGQPATPSAPSAPTGAPPPSGAPAANPGGGR
ncbi:MAG TPA: cytochrome c [Thermoanaerobaculia bacterium]|jgi:mono/diheme cytochrome c family protein|nr:cytochrome c [Thermoanaerobaculia bacterium]